MDNLIRFWNGSTIRQREDGYFSATDMCKAGKKNLADWVRLKDTKEYLQALSDDTGLSVSVLVEMNRGGIPNLQGTWVHRLAAIELARWLSPRFSIQCNKWVEEFLIREHTSAHEGQSPQSDALVDAFSEISISPKQVMSRYLDAGYVYFIQDAKSKHVKIGKSKNPGQRLRSLQSATSGKLKIIKLVPTFRCSDVELSLHKRFQEYRLYGEWFKPEVLNLLDFLEKQESL